MCYNGGGGTPEVNKFEKVSSDGHQMSRARRSLYSEVPYLEGGLFGEGSCTVRSNASWVMVTCDPSSLEQNDRETSVKILPSHNFIDGR